jgi:hypothetical protein
MFGNFSLQEWVFFTSKIHFIFLLHVITR